MDRKIRMVGVHGLLGGPGSAQYSRHHAMFQKGKAACDDRVSYGTFQQNEGPKT